MRLALFDLDDTLFDGDTDIAWSDLLAEEGAQDASRTRAYHEQYRAGTLDIDEFFAFQLEPLARHPLPRLLAWRERFLRERILPRISPLARTLVREHQTFGHELVLITATNSFLTRPISEALGIPHLVASEPERVGGRFTGRLEGVPCFREGKVTKLVEWLALRGLRMHELEASFFYSDSHNDLPLLGSVTHPVAVDPDPVLERHARLHGWPILELHERHGRAQAAG
ncbi:MAG: HAD family hydrolase [Planctomycetes bacterium]|nr:HAD family hydrolase [Planctomycetota bacterium]